MVADEAAAAAETEVALAASTNLFCGNLDPNVDEEMLCALFMPFGEVLTIKILWPPAQLDIEPGAVPPGAKPYRSPSVRLPRRSLRARMLASWRVWQRNYRRLTDPRPRLACPS